MLFEHGYCKKVSIDENRSAERFLYEYITIELQLYSYLNLESTKIGIASLIVVLNCNKPLSLFPYVISL